MEREGFPVRVDSIAAYYNCSMRFEINLYTAGMPLTGDKDAIYAYENTAIEDLEEYTRFLDSEAVTDQMARAGIAILLASPIKDLSELIGDTKFNYRAMAEFVVTFVEMASGRYGVGSDATAPNPSGGGKPEYADAKNYEIREVEIKEKTENEEEINKQYHK